MLHRLMCCIKERQLFMLQHQRDICQYCSSSFQREHTSTIRSQSVSCSRVYIMCKMCYSVCRMMMTALPYTSV